MTYAATAARSGRQPIALAELLLDFCQLRYATSPCTAAIGVTGATYCYNTRATCQDLAHYSPAARAYRFCTPAADLPIGLDALPMLRGVSMAPTKMDIAGGLGARASVTLTLQDAASHDRAVDPYWRQRYGAGPFLLAVDGDGSTLALDAAGTELSVRDSGTTTSIRADGSNLPGSFLGRLRARNVHYLGRVCRIKTGYLGLDESEWITRTYLIESITGPDNKGAVAIKAKDPLKLADDDRAVAPAAASGALLEDVDESVTAFTITPESALDAFDASGYCRVGSEVCTYEKGSGATLTVVRGQSGTDAATHDAGDTVQPCLRIAARTIPQILQTLLADYAGVPAEYLPVDEWQAECDAYLPQVYSALITEATAVTTLVKELSQSGPFSIWWDERRALVRIRALRAPDSDVVLDETTHLLADSVTVTDKPDQRISQQWVFLGQSDPTGSLETASNWRQLVIVADLDAESDLEFGVSSINKLYSRWLISRATAQDLASLLVARFTDVPREIKFSLDAKDGRNWWTGDIVRISSRLVQQPDGQNEVLAVQIQQANESSAAHRVDYVAMAFSPTAYQAQGEVIVISDNVDGLNLYELYVARTGAAPTADTVVTFVIEASVIVGQGESADQALRTGIWPTGYPNSATVMLENNGRIQGRGGRGGDAYLGSAGIAGGNALRAEYPITVFNYGEIWGGGGGGGCVGSQGTGFGGGGGAGSPPGAGGQGEKGNNGAPGTTTAGGAGARVSSQDVSLNDGGDPGEPGDRGTQKNTHNYAPGAAGYYAIGNTYITWSAAGDCRGRVDVAT